MAEGIQVKRLGLAFRGEYAVSPAYLVHIPGDIAQQDGDHIDLILSEGEARLILDRLQLLTVWVTG